MKARVVDLTNLAADPLRISRDLSIDELTDMVESGLLDRDEQEFLASKLIRMLPQEADPQLLESIFNLLSHIYDSGYSKEEIVSISIGLLSRLEPGSLVHVIPIIWNSGHADRNVLLEPFSCSNNMAVRSIALELLGVASAAREPRS